MQKLKNALKTALSLVLAAAVTMAAPYARPRTVFAASTDTVIDVGDSATTSGTNWTYAAGVFTVTGDVTIRGTTTTNCVVVTADANITLNGVGINVSTINGVNALQITNGASVNLTLRSGNFLTAGMPTGSTNRVAALNVAAGSTLVIDGLGLLTARGGDSSAAIGGDDGQEAGSIIINGGTINAYGHSAGIGGSFAHGFETIIINDGTITASGEWGIGGIPPSTGYITINGGTVTAISDKNGGAGIGGVGTTNCVDVIITGGTVTAAGDASGPGIGGHANRRSGNITIAGLATVTATGGDGVSGGGGAGIGTGGGASVAPFIPSDIIIESSATVNATGGAAGNTNNKGANIGAGGSTSAADTAGAEYTAGTNPSNSPNYYGTTVTRYTISLSPTVGGTITTFRGGITSTNASPATQNVVKNAGSSYEITADAGYKLVSVTAGGHTIVGAGTSYSILNVTSADTITATFAPVPVLSAIANAATTVGTAYSKTIGYSYAGVNTLTFSATGLPTGVTIDPTTGIISGTPTTAGTYTINVTVSDGTYSDAVSYVLRVNPASVPVPAPTLYTITFDANGGDVSPTSAQTPAGGTLAVLPTPTRNGYTFDGWFTLADGGLQVLAGDIFTADMTIFAHWTERIQGVHSRPEPTPAPTPIPAPTPVPTATPEPAAPEPQPDLYVRTLVGNGSIIITTLRGQRPADNGGGTLILPYGGTIATQYGSYAAPAGTIVFTDGSGVKLPNGDWLNIYGKNPFADVFESDWFFNDVMYVYYNGLMSGQNGLFRPHDHITLGEMAGILFNRADASQGTITRQDMLVILYEFANATGIVLRDRVPEQPFADDAKVADYAKEAVYALYRAGVISGRPGGGFDPLSNVTYAEMAAMLRRLVR